MKVLCHEFKTRHKSACFHNSKNKELSWDVRYVQICAIKSNKGIGKWYFDIIYGAKSVWYEFVKVLSHDKEVQYEG